MPIKKGQTHSEIVSELMSSYNKTGKIGNAVPKNKTHAEEIANAIAYQTRHESLLKLIKIVNEKESMQLSLNSAKNIQEYLRRVSFDNAREINTLVNSFVRRYFEFEKKRYSASKTPIISYNTANLIYNKIGSTEIVAGYRQELSGMNMNSCTSAVLSSEHFYTVVEDSNLIVSMNSSYLTEILDTVDELKM